MLRLWIPMRLRTAAPLLVCHKLARRAQRVWDLDYTSYSSFGAHLSPDPKRRGTTPPRYRLVEFDNGFFWDDSPDLYSSYKASTEDGRRSRRALCLVQQPGCSLLLFRTLVYEDVPDLSFIHGLTIRDPTARIEGTSTERKSASHTIGPARHVPAVIALEQVAELASAWMRRCGASHQKYSAGPSRLPRRWVIDVQGGVRLVDTAADEDVSATAPYMTPSHCWGNPKTASLLLRTTHGTLAQHREQIQWEQLPRLFRDVVNLVRALGCRYVWIDSLCIVQDDGEDGVEESANMSEIYNKADPNIAATSMRSVPAGLFQHRTHGQGFRRLRKSADRGGGGGGGGADYSAVPSLESIEAGEVDGRAVFARTSHDRSHEVLYGDLDFFRTPMEPLLGRATGCFCECMRITNAHGLSVRDINSTQTKKVLFSDVCEGPGDSRAPFDFWLRACQEFSFLFLSRETGRPFALAGIAKRIQMPTGDRYLAGLWARDLPRAMLWAPYKHVAKHEFQADRRLAIDDAGTFCN
ncbi:heterokaryon incompatibility protein-domain-containing protein [Lasiosphaeria miniovina]|uniref:Heterokaryon incompatibility protein-domain-containing protein n=1 Tax=Lasiosphaeria miniovina TaxID=1954250 RepID=A0AA39ZYU2_9PEZI|nr:heterokaryon incompatibility protein-domain-containing protein [Lasiosphaeria miniovina]KAK0706151.1 heterokaryon incompatibility protein-domain-containing protein [Lasiosphaeria miniovina]